MTPEEQSEYLAVSSTSQDKEAEKAPAGTRRKRQRITTSSTERSAAFSSTPTSYVGRQQVRRSAEPTSPTTEKNPFAAPRLGEDHASSPARTSYRRRENDRRDYPQYERGDEDANNTRLFSHHVADREDRYSYANEPRGQYRTSSMEDNETPTYPYAPKRQRRGSGYRGEGDASQRSYPNKKGQRLSGRMMPRGNKRNRPLTPKRKAKNKVLPEVIRHASPLESSQEPLRLNKFLSNAGVCSRRDADKLIVAGEVSVNGTVVTELGVKIMPQDHVEVSGKGVVKPESKVYVLLNKPKNVVTTSDDPQERRTVMDLVRHACPERIYPVGRLDRNTTGLLLLTNDGDLSARLTHPSYMKKKIYHVWLDKDVSVEHMQAIASGIELPDGPIHADAISYVVEGDRKQVGIELHSGRNRIVRRIFEHLGYRVLKLDRVYFAGLTKKDLPRGKWRFLNEEEVRYLWMGVKTAAPEGEELNITTAEEIEE